MKIINILISLLLAVVILSCEEPDYGAPKPSATVNYAKITFVNAAPNTSELPFLVNNAEGASLGFTSASGYVDATANAQQFRLKNVVYGVVGSDTVPQKGDLALQSTIVGGLRYTLFVTDTLKRPFGKKSAFNTEKGGLRFFGPIADALTAPGAGNAGIRFYNVAAGAPAIFLTAGGNVLAGTLSNSRAYRTTSSDFAKFVAVTTGSYDLEVRTGSATGTVIATLPATALAEGKLYTIYLSGMKVSSGIKVPYAVNLITHN